MVDQRYMVFLGQVLQSSPLSKVSTVILAINAEKSVHFSTILNYKIKVNTKIKIHYYYKFVIIFDI